MNGHALEIGTIIHVLQTGSCCFIKSEWYIMSYGLYITYSMYNKFLGQMFKKKKDV